MARCGKAGQLSKIPSKEIAGHPMGCGLQPVCHFRSEQPGRVLGPHTHPGRKVGGRDALQLHVLAQHIAFKAMLIKVHRCRFSNVIRR